MSTASDQPSVEVRTAVCHSPDEPDPQRGQHCRWCGMTFLEPEELKSDPAAFWSPDRLVVEYRPGFDGSERSLRRQLTPPLNSTFCDPSEDYSIQSDG